MKNIKDIKYNDKAQEQAWQNFREIYYKFLKPIMAEMEIERQKTYNIAIKDLTSAFLVFLLCILLGSRYFSNGYCFAIISAVFIWMLSILPVRNMHFIKKLKVKCMSLILSTWLEGLRLSWNSSTSELKQSKLFADFEDAVWGDRFEGKINNQQILIRECKLFIFKKRQHDELLEGFYCIFRGIILQMSMNKTMNGITIAAWKKDFGIKNINITWLAAGVLILVIAAAFWGYMTAPPQYQSICLILASLTALIPMFIICRKIDRFFHNTKSNKNNVFENYSLQRVYLEDPEFNRRYKVYSNDQIEGRYLITPAFMERFKNIQTAFGTQNVKCSFVDDKFFLAIPTKQNAFEIGNLFTPLDNPKHLEKFFREFSSILLLMDYFKLDERTGL